MSDADAELRALFVADQPPASDPVFRLAVIERRALGQLRKRMALLVSCGLAATAALVAIAPTLPAQADALLAQALWPGACIAIAILSTGWGLAQLRRPV